MNRDQTGKKLAPILGNDQKIEVAIEDDTTVIKLFSWVEGLGWSCQKTVGLESSLLDDLHRSLAAARRKVNRNSGDAAPGKLIMFPSVS